MTKTQVSLPLAAAGALIIAAGAFYGGSLYGKNQAFAGGPGTGMRMRQDGGTPGNGQANGATQGGNRQGMNGMRPIGGEIVSLEDGTITLKLTDGGSKVVLVSDTTSYAKTSEIAKTDLKVGDEITVMGITNQDGSVTAQNVQSGLLMRRQLGQQDPAKQPAQPQVDQKVGQ